MAGSINRIIIGGRLGADPEIRNVSDLKRVAKLSVATSESWTNADGEPTESVQWHAVVIWKPASIDFAGRNLKKGDLIIAEGQMEYRQYETNGQNSSGRRDRHQSWQRRHHPDGESTGATGPATSPAP